MATATARTAAARRESFLIFLALSSYLEQYFEIFVLGEKLACSGNLEGASADLIVLLIFIIVFTVIHWPLSLSFDWTTAAFSFHIIKGSKLQVSEHVFLPLCGRGSTCYPWIQNSALVRDRCGGYSTSCVPKDGWYSHFGDT